MSKGFLNKHHMAVHAGADFSLIERKLVNALIYHAMPSLKFQNEHSINVCTLLSLIELKTRNYTKIYSGIRKIACTLIEWGVLKTSSFEGELTGVTILEMFKIKNGLITYRFPKEFCSLLIEPKRYAKLRMSSVMNLKSSYGVALYENCASYTGLGDTGWISLDDFRKLMGIDKKYPQFRDLKRRVISGAIKDVNRATEYNVELMEQKRLNRTTKLRFKISSKDNNVIPIDKPKSSNAPKDEGQGAQLLEKLNELGISRLKGLEWLAKFDEAYIAERLDYVNTYKEAKNKAALLSASIEKAYQISHSQSEPVRLAAPDTKLYQSYKTNLIVHWLRQLQETSHWKNFCEQMIDFVEPILILHQEFTNYLFNKSFWENAQSTSDVIEFSEKLFKQCPGSTRCFNPPLILSQAEFAREKCQEIT